MRILVCTDRIGALSSAEAGAALGRAFVAARPNTQVAVVAMGAAGADLAAALAAVGDRAVVVAAEPPAEIPDGIDRAASSVAVGHALAAALAQRPQRVVVDLTHLHTHDGGTGMLAALGATADVPLDRGVAALGGLSRLDLAPVRARLGETDLVGVVPGEQLGDLLLGLRGLTARRAHLGGVTDRPALLETDGALGVLAGLLGVPDAPGVGAAGGAALAVVALGGWLTTGPALVAGAAGLERTASLADVVVTGSDALDAVERGGPVVREVVAVAERAQRPCVVVAREVGVQGREMRSFGIEAAHALGGDAVLRADDLTMAASRVAATWTW